VISNYTARCTKRRVGGWGSFPLSDLARRCSRRCSSGSSRTGPCTSRTPPAPTPPCSPASPARCAISHSLARSLTHSHSLTHSLLSLSLFVSRALAHSHSHSLTLSLTLSLSHSLYLSLYLSHSLSLSLYLSPGQDPLDVKQMPAGEPVAAAAVVAKLYGDMSFAAASSLRKVCRSLQPAPLMTHHYERCGFRTVTRTALGDHFLDAVLNGVVPDGGGREGGAADEGDRAGLHERQRRRPLGAVSGQGSCCRLPCPDPVSAALLAPRQGSGHPRSFLKWTPKVIPGLIHHPIWWLLTSAVAEGRRRPPQAHPPHDLE
jgi:hypothetical protein